MRFPTRSPAVFPGATPSKIDCRNFSRDTTNNTSARCPDGSAARGCIPMESRAMKHALALAVVLGMGTILRADEPPAKAPKKDGPFGDLGGALKATPGCLGVESARTSSGKQVIFAWFENKK